MRVRDRFSHFCHNSIKQPIAMLSCEHRGDLLGNNAVFLGKYYCKTYLISVEPRDLFECIFDV